MAKGKFEIKGLDGYLEALKNAEHDIDQVVTDVLNEAKPIAEERIHQYLKQSSENWTGNLDSTVEVSDAQQEGNYVFIELRAGGSDAPYGFYKEYGTSSMAAEPFLRPSLTYLRRTGLKKMMKAVLEKFGLKT